MVEISPELVVVLMFGGMLIGIFFGYPLAIVLGGVAMFVGMAAMGPPVFNLLRSRIYDFLSNYIFLAVPLFIYMGVVVERSGAAEKLYRGLYLWFGGVRGGLAIATVLMGTILAACVGVIAASVTMIGLVAMPSMLKRGYNKELVCGSVCAGGTLGILIPPSIMLIVYGSAAAISVGKLYMAAFMPGLVLSGLYVVYIAIHCWLNPQLAPVIAPEERAISLSKKVRVLLLGMLPPVFLVVAVLGTIFFGIAAPTESAAIGCVAAIILAMSYRRFNWQIFREGMLNTLRVTSMVYIIGFSAYMFTGVFLRLGGGDAVSNVLFSVPGGKWGFFTAIMFIVFVLGFFIDWIGILFIIVPLVTPIGKALGFDTLWFAMMVCVNLQMSFLTPPLAYTIFYVQGFAKPEWGIDTGHIIRGVVPFVVLIMVGLGLCLAFPEIILWLPGMMIK